MRRLFYVLKIHVLPKFATKQKQFLPFSLLAIVNYMHVSHAATDNVAFRA